jgi:hypothetical protein
MQTRTPIYPQAEISLPGPRNYYRSYEESTQAAGGILVSFFSSEWQSAHLFGVCL